MPSISNATARRVSHAAGYLALGLVDEATAELAAIASADLAIPEVLNARIELHLAKKEWAWVIGFGRELATRHSDVDVGWIGWATPLAS
jgi:hypothetical protein